MRILTWAILAALFVLLLAFAAKNSDPVTLRFYFGLEWKEPLILLLFGFFVAGAILGLVARQLTVFRLSRQLRGLKRGGPTAADPVQPGPAEG